MKVFVILLIIILVFLGCARIGYEMANRVEAAEAQKQAGEPIGLKSDQTNLVFLRV